jgi:hypothetical protein
MARPVGSKTTPSYCFHKQPGKAYVTIDGRQVLLGKFNSKDSREKYDRVIGEWLANGRRSSPQAAPSSPTTVAATDGSWATMKSHSRGSRSVQSYDGGRYGVEQAISNMHWCGLFPGQHCSAVA